MRTLIIVLFTLMVLTIKPVTASHSMGGDISYRWVSGNQYEFTLTLYRDCFGITLPASIQLCADALASCVYSYTPVLNQVSITEISATCPTSTSTCSGGAYPGIQKVIYKGPACMELYCGYGTPDLCNDMEFGARVVERNIAPTTAPFSGSIANTFMFIKARLNNIDGPNNSSPYFTNDPVTVTCVNQPFLYNPGAIDPEGDSLVFALINPLNAVNASSNGGCAGVWPSYQSTNLTYKTGFSYLAPLTASPQISINSVTGDITFTPTVVGEDAVFAYKVSEYKSGKLIGSIMREQQILVVNCTNNLPTVSGINGTASYATSVCANNSLCFTVNSNDIDVGQTLSMLWNAGITGASYTIAGTPPVGTFCWTPSSSNINTIPYLFTVSVKDDACPYLGKTSRGFAITVNNCALPIDLINFYAVNYAGTNILRWVTASEKNVDYFLLENSIDGENFKSLGKVEKSDHTEGPGHYEFIDKSPATGINYYRLRQYDLDGNYSFSQKISTCNETPNIFEAIYKENNICLTFELPYSGEESVIEMYNITGVLLKREIIAPSYTKKRNVFFPVAQVPNGIYYLRLIAGGKENAARVSIFK